MPLYYDSSYYSHFRILEVIYFQQWSPADLYLWIKRARWEQLAVILPGLTGSLMTRQKSESFWSLEGSVSWHLLGIHGVHTVHTPITNANIILNIVHSKLSTIHSFLYIALIGRHICGWGGENSCKIHLSLNTELLPWQIVIQGKQIDLSLSSQRLYFHSTGRYVCFVSVVPLPPCIMKECGIQNSGWIPSYIRHEDFPFTKWRPSRE